MPDPLPRPELTINAFYGSPGALVRTGWRHRHLIGTLVRRDIASRYRGSLFGMLWSVLNPVLLLAIYTFVFSEIFRMRWGTANDNPLDFALMLFAGMLVFAFFSEAVNRAPSLIVSNPNLVKRIVFPLETQAWVVVGAGLFQVLISLAVLLVAFVLIRHSPPHWTVVLFPVVAVPLCFLVLGFVWFLSSLGVYLRDVGQVVGHLVTMMMFLSPLFYPVTAVPAGFRNLFYLNPLTLLMGETRKVLILGQTPDWVSLGAFTAATFLFACFGYWWFQRTRRGFADVL